MDGIKEKLMDLLLEVDAVCGVRDCEDCVDNGICFIHRAADHLIANGVTVRAKGEWVHDPLSSYGVHVWFCSQCNGEVLRQTDFCPNCGADMRQGAEHESD